MPDWFNCFPRVHSISCSAQKCKLYNTVLQPWTIMCILLIFSIKCTVIYWSLLQVWSYDQHIMNTISILTVMVNPGSLIYEERLWEQTVSQWLGTWLCGHCEWVIDLVSNLIPSDPCSWGSQRWLRQTESEPVLDFCEFVFGKVISFWHISRLPLSKFVCSATWYTKLAEKTSLCLVKVQPLKSWKPRCFNISLFGPFFCLASLSDPVRAVASVSMPHVLVVAQAPVAAVTWVLGPSDYYKKRQVCKRVSTSKIRHCFFPTQNPLWETNVVSKWPEKCKV